MHPVWLVAFLLLAATAEGHRVVKFSLDEESDSSCVDGTCKDKKFVWDSLLRSGERIVSNGQVWPAPPDDHADNCLILLTHNQVLQHCPDTGKTTVVYQRQYRRFRGAFMLPDGDRHRLWLLSSPVQAGWDVIEELDTLRREVLQILLIPGTTDSHDAVRVGDSVFICDTYHGNIVELELPEPASPHAPMMQYYSGQNATVLKRHSGFHRGDHVNNVAVHPELLLASLHGSGSMDAATRLSALARKPIGGKHRDLGDGDGLGFSVVDNVGKWAHGIAFWGEDAVDGESQIKLISLDSSTGSLVSVVLSGPGAEERTREVLWEPDLTHPVLTPHHDLPNGYKGTFVFSKGLAVQGGIAYFGVSGARRPQDRMTINPSLLVAVDLKSKEELFVRTINSIGLINQVVSEAYLGHPLTVVEHTAQNQGTHQQGHAGDSRLPKITSHDFFRTENLDVCVDDNGKTRHIPIKYKEEEYATLLNRVFHPTWVTEHICNINVDAVRDKLIEVGEEAFTEEGQKSNAKITNRKQNLDDFKPGVTAIIFIFSDRQGRQVYHFSWLDDWLPVFNETIFAPLHIDLNNIVRLQFGNMTVGSTINSHIDLGGWVQRTHRVHVPITTNPLVYFLAESPRGQNVRVKSGAGQVFEFNNAVQHAVRNYGGNRVHLIIDWAEDPPDSITKLNPGQVCHYNGPAGVLCDS